MTGQLAGKIAIVTGAGAGIGRAAALLFAREGARMVLNARREAPLRDLAAEIEGHGGEAIVLPGDVADERTAEGLAAAAVERFGGLDIAFNNAGTMGPLAPTPSISLQDWNETLAVNLTAAFLAARHQIPAMEARGAGSLIFTGSFVGYSVAFPGTASYAASKAGLVGLVQALAAEVGPLGIRVNALLPGGTDTAMAADFADSEEKRAYVRSIHALKRIATPEEMARSALYLASDASSFTTGTALLADGGVSISRS